MCTKKGKLWEIDADSDDTDADSDEGLMSKMSRWADVQVGKWADIAKFSEPNSIPFRIFSLKNIVFFPNRTGLGSEFFLGLDIVFFYFRTESNSVWKILSQFLRFVFRTELESVRKRTLFKM